MIFFKLLKVFSSIFNVLAKFQNYTLIFLFKTSKRRWVKGCFIVFKN